MPVADLGTWQIWAPVLGAIVVALVAAAVSVVNSRNDRAMSNLEADLLKKLDPESEVARQLHAVIEARVTDWYRKAYKIKKTPTGDKPVKRRTAAVVGWLLIILILAPLVIVAISGFISGFLEG